MFERQLRIASPANSSSRSKNITEYSGFRKCLANPRTSLIATLGVTLVLDDLQVEVDHVEHLLDLEALLLLLDDVQSLLDVRLVVGDDLLRELVRVRVVEHLVREPLPHEEEPRCEHREEAEADDHVLAEGVERL